VKPLLSEYGVALLIEDEMVQLGDRFYVKAKAMLQTPSGGHLSAAAYAREPLSKKGMDEAQITGATSSYARKYALNGLFAIDDTKDADTQDNRKEKVNPEPISQQKVDNAVFFFKARIDEDCPEETSELIKTAFKKLTNDEKIAVADKMGDKAPDSGKMYKNLLKDHLNYKPGEK